MFQLLELVKLKELQDIHYFVLNEYWQCVFLAYFAISNSY